ncbi:hypothetical protein Aperf_G00000115992 [Anoplocephala perfoliata]
MSSSDGLILYTVPVRNRFGPLMEDGCKIRTARRAGIKGSPYFHRKYPTDRPDEQANKHGNTRKADDGLQRGNPTTEKGLNSNQIRSPPAPWKRRCTFTWSEYRPKFQTGYSHQRGVRNLTLSKTNYYEKKITSNGSMGMSEKQLQRNKEQQQIGHQDEDKAHAGTVTSLHDKNSEKANVQKLRPIVRLGGFTRSGTGAKDKQKKKVTFRDDV